MHILITDDHAVVRRGLREILADSLEGATFCEAGNADDALRLMAKHPIRILVLDINMPGRSGLDLLKDVKGMYPRVPVIVLSVQPEDQYAVRCLRAGASAYINKDSAPEELAQAARKVLGGGRYVSPGLAEKLVTILDDDGEKPRHELLSDRELEVMLMIASGVSLTEIGNRLHVSAKTVSTYRSRVMDKMQARSNAELTRYAVSHNLIE
jgi:two-component system, NarL family, invasion response regulator UvrY